MRNIEKFMDKWGKERKKGKAKYILINSVIYIILSWIAIIISYISKGKALNRLTESLELVIVSVVIYIICLFRLWKKNEEIYKRNL